MTVAVGVLEGRMPDVKPASPFSASPSNLESDVSGARNTLVWEISRPLLVASVLDKHEDEADYYYDWDLGRNM